MNLLETPAQLLSLFELGRSALRGTDLLDLVGNQSGALLFVHCREIVPISESPFREVPLYQSTAQADLVVEKYSASNKILDKVNNTTIK